uniref:Premelanosome protein n=1 Tax=Leptobrachium leishanense TaxID=445787 RepID=A0A8C5MN09_9ANUR
MKGIWCLAVLWVLCAGIDAQNRSRNRAQQSKQQLQGNKRPPFKSWNSQMYPIWSGREDQKRDCWKGGKVTFDIVNDSPTLTGAKTTFSIKLNFPKNQTVLPDGQVIWNQNCTDNGTWVPSGEPVYPDETTEGADCTFPDGRTFPDGSEKRRSKFVYVWQTWGKYWQVVDGPVSNLTVDTDDVPLGSYNMEVVIYHYRGRQKFIPIGSISSQFAITDQIPISVSISQLQDLNQADQRFVQNRAVSFSVAVHDPSHYLATSDLSFSWDFGDQSGTLITRNTDVTHTYIISGVFKPRVILQAAIPISPCGSTAVPVSEEPVATTEVPLEPTSDVSVTTESSTDLPTDTAAPSNVTLAAEAELVSAESADLNMEAAETVAPTSLQAEEAGTLPEVLPAEGEDAPLAETAANEVVASDVAPVEQDTVTLPEVAQSPVEALTVLPDVPSSVSFQEAEVPPATEQVLILAKRQAPEAVGCILYRYGTFATELDVVQGIESVQIVQVDTSAAVGLANAVDLTVVCQGSLPSQVCTIVSGPDCQSPQETECNPVEPSTDCQMVLRQVFNGTGTFCVNVSLTDDVSLAVASAQVTVSGSASSTNGIAVTVGVLLAALAVVAVAYTYRRTKPYTPLRVEASSINWLPDRSSLRLFFQNALGRAINGEDSPLLNGRVV